MENDKIKVLSQHLDCDIKEIKVSSYDDNVFDYGKQEYLVVTDSEADERWEEELNSYIDEIVLSEIPEHYHNYFDYEKWKNDAKQDGRGHCLDRYSGAENFETVDNETFYIYRLN